MSSLITNATIQIRKDTAGNWTSNNPTPAAGEWCYETDTKFLKIGDGSTVWTSLDYQPTVAEVTAKASLSTYSTGWVANNDWSAVSLSVTHSLNANLSDLIVKVFISTDGTEANAFEIGSVDTTLGVLGFTIFQTDTNGINIETGTNGMHYINIGGLAIVLAAQSYYYKVKVYKLS